ncbi:MAG: MFS transporter, partial [Rectinema sp.]|nr:MFS transporter [Rectinema sp.]
EAVRTQGSLTFRFAFGYVSLFSIYAVSSPYLQIMVRRLGYNPSAVGLFLGMFELIGIGGPIVLARIADHQGRFRPFLVISGMMVLVGLWILVSFRIPWLTILSLGLLSLGLKTPIPVLDASLFSAADEAAAHGRPKPSYGVLRGLGSVGFVAVTLLLQSVPGFETGAPALMALVMGLLTLLFVAASFALPETGHRAAVALPHFFSLRWIDAPFLIGMAVIALGRFAMTSVGSFFSLYLVEELKWHAIGAMWALSAGVEIPFIVFSWKFIQKHSPMRAIAIASCAIVVRLLIYALLPSPGGAIAGQLLHSLCYGLFQPAAIAFVSLKTPPAERTTGMAIFMGLGVGLPSFLGSALGGALVEVIGYRGLFAVFALFAIASLAVFWKYRTMMEKVR